jgi:hypothetical protein
MQTVKVGVREFREKLAGYLESGRPLAIMRHGETLGYQDLDEMIASWGTHEDEVMEEYKGIRRAAREQKRNAR